MNIYFHDTCRARSIVTKKWRLPFMPEREEVAWVFDTLKKVRGDNGKPEERWIQCDDEPVSTSEFEQELAFPPHGLKPNERDYKQVQSVGFKVK